jgi:hypothetical protein
MLPCCHAASCQAAILITQSLKSKPALETKILFFNAGIAIWLEVLTKAKKILLFIFLTVFQPLWVDFLPSS